MTAFMQLAPADRPERLQSKPTVPMQVLNFIVFEAAWFAAVLGAAHHVPLLGTACVIAAIVWHLAVSARPATEARLLACVCLIGVVVESINASQGDIAYTSGQPGAHAPPYWMVALWGLLAIALNVTMRWMRGRLWLAAAVGAVAGPLSFISGVRLGAAEFVHPTAAIVSLAVTWAVLLPALIRLSMHFDGVSTRQGTQDPKRA